MADWNDVGIDASSGFDVTVPLLKKPVYRWFAVCWLANSVPNATVCFQTSVSNLKVPIGLVDRVLAIILVVVSRQRVSARVRHRTARVDVLIEPLVIGE